VSDTKVFIHHSALCESNSIGAGTRVWAFAHVMKGARIGGDCNIGDHAFIESGVTIGDRVTIKNGVMIWNGITIEDDVLIGPGAVFTNDRFPRSPRMIGTIAVTQRYSAERHWLARTHVERGASIGAAAVLGSGVRIGAFAAVGAGAVVTKNVPAHRLVLGVPAREVGWVCACGRPVATMPTSPQDCRHGPAKAG
jgi:acetyltransferase-like isoleucine patch superfamily enzyme